jgi:hypothetical protein
VITKTEHTVDDEGRIVRERIYHRAGNMTVDGALRRDEKYSWTHPVDEQKTCVACTKGTIPPEVKGSTRRAVVR